MEEEAKIEIVPYDPAWLDKFLQEKKLIEATIGEYIAGGVHHIGSTAVPNLAAKPIIDIMVGVDSLEASRPCIDLLSGIQYNYFPYHPESEHWFCKPSPQYRTHHLHIIATTHPEFTARLAFRDYLRGHPDEAKAYEDLKKKLALEFRDDREAYTDAKTDFVKTIVAKAQAK